jgi:hypothetical protein
LARTLKGTLAMDECLFEVAFTGRCDPQGHAGFSVWAWCRVG